MLRSGVAALVLACRLSFAENGGEPIIETIEVRVEDVFEDSGGTPDFWGYRFLNRLHLETRESVIRRELLFREGEPVSAEALAQTERNLRALPFLRDARVETFAEDGDEGRVHVRVTASDSWSTLPEIRFAKVGDVWTWALGASEANLLGRGKHLQAIHRSGLDRDETFAFYRDPRVFGSRVAAGVFLSSASDGHRVDLSARRPFYAIDTLWGFGARVEDFERLDPLWENGDVVSELHHLRRSVELDAARAVHRTSSSAVRLHFGYQSARDVIDGGLDRREFGILRVGVSRVEHRFLKLTHVNRFERPEDFNLGSEASAFFGLSAPALGGEDGLTSFFFLAGGRGFRLHRAGFFRARASWQARRRHGRIENSFARLRLDALHKLDARKLVLAKAELVYGSSLDPEVQLRLGAASGLRGYPVRQFNGNRSLLTSVESRWFLLDDVMRLVSVGVAAFFDSGFVWPEGRPIAFHDLRSNLGVSVLLGRNRISVARPGVRFDVAYALSPIERRSPWLLSVGSAIGF